MGGRSRQLHAEQVNTVHVHGKCCSQMSNSKMSNAYVCMYVCMYVFSYWASGRQCGGVSDFCLTQWRIEHCILIFSSSLIVYSTHTLLFNTQNTCPTLRMTTMICFSPSFARNLQDKRRATHGQHHQKRRAWSRRPKNLPPPTPPNPFL